MVIAKTQWLPFYILSLPLSLSSATTVLYADHSGQNAQRYGECQLPPNKFSLPESCRELQAASIVPVSAPLPFLLPCSLNPPTFRCSDAQTSQICLGFRLGVFCWIVSVQLVVISRVEINGTP